LVQSSQRTIQFAPIDASDAITRYRPVKSAISRLNEALGDISVTRCISIQYAEDALLVYAEEDRSAKAPVRKSITSGKTVDVAILSHD